MVCIPLGCTDGGYIVGEFRKRVLRIKLYETEQTSSAHWVIAPKIEA